MNDQQNIFEQIFELDTLLHKYYERRREGRGHGAHPRRGQDRVLSILKLQPEISQKELSFMLDMRKQSLGELLTKLEGKGHITREAAEEDHRAMLVKLTAEGAAAAAEIEADVELRDSLAESLTAEERAQFSAYLTKLIAAVDGEIKSLPQEPERQAFGGGRFGHRFEEHPRGHGGFPGHGFTPRGAEPRRGANPEGDARSEENAGAFPPGCHNCPLQRKTKIAAHRCPDCPKHQHQH